LFVSEPRLVVVESRLFVSEPRLFAIKPQSFVIEPRLFAFGLQLFAVGGVPGWFVQHAHAVARVWRGAGRASMVLDCAVVVFFFPHFPVMGQRVCGWVLAVGGVTL